MSDETGISLDDQVLKCLSLFFYNLVGLWQCLTETFNFSNIVFARESTFGVRCIQSQWVQDKNIIVGELGHAEQLDDGVGDLPEVKHAMGHVVCGKGLEG